MIKFLYARSRRLAVLAFVALAIPTPGLAQSLPQTAAFVLSGGMVNDKDMRPIDQDSIEVPAYMIGLMGMVPAMSLKVLDRKTCTVRYEQRQPDRALYMEFYLSKVIFEETREQRAERNQLYSLYTVRYAGEDPIYCSFSGAQKSCGRTFDSTVDEKNLSRVYKAWQHLFAQHCAGAERKGAF